MRKVRYYLERPTEGTPANITLYFVYKVDTLKMATGEKILPEHWDKNIQRPKRRFLANTKLKYKALYEFLEDLEAKAVEIVTEYRRARKLRSLDKDKFRTLLKSYLEGGPDDEGVTLFEYLDQYIEEKEKANKAKETIKMYHATKKHIYTFADKHLGFRFDFEDINLGLFRSFRDYYWQNKRAYADSTVHKYLSNFKEIIRQAYNEGFHNNSRFDVDIARDLGVRKTQADAIALTVDEVIKLAELELAEEEAIARDLFIVGCFTGLRVSDWHKINREKIREIKGVKVLKLYTKKGKKAQYIPVVPRLENILEKYGYILPKMHRNEVNKLIKEIARKAGLTQVETFQRIERGEHITYKEKRYQRIHNHTARRTFATILRSFNIPAEKAKIFTGHSSEKMFKIYDKYDELEEIVKIAENDFFRL